MLEMVGQIGIQIAPTFFVVPNDVVYPLDGHARFPVALSDTDNSLRRPMLLDALLDILPVLFRQFLRPSGNRFSHFGELLCIDCNVVSIHVGVSFYLPANG